MAKIIVIEDEANIREEVMDWLLFEGYEVVGASNGRLGLDAVYRENPDLILCDITMPEVDGHEVLIEVRADVNLSHIPFIFLTAAADRDSVRRGMDLGADDYMTKPFTHSEVLNAVRSRLDKRAMQNSQMQQQLESLGSAFQEERGKRLLKSRLVAMFSHDFRNPLAAILSSAEILEHYGERLDTARKVKHLHMISGAVYTLLQMLDDMLLVAEIDSEHLKYVPQPTDLTGLINTIIDEFRLIDRQTHEITYSSDVESFEVVDPKLIRQIVANLVSNALKYSPAETEVSVKLTAGHDQLQLRVQDKGRGIPDAEVPHLFEPFYRASNVTNVKGTGLGLSIVSECVRQHQGHIEVSSVLGQGTCFLVQLPRQNGKEG